MSRGGLREDIRVHPLAGLHGTDGALRDLRQGFGGVRDPLTSVELFIALRRRSARLLDEIKGLPASRWRRVSLDVPARKYKTPRVATIATRP